MNLHLSPARTIARWVIVALAVGILLDSSAYVLAAGPFARLPGQWSGSGTIDLASGAQEPIKCRASYDALNEQTNLQLYIRCASDSYNFELRGSANYSNGSISGTWSESTRNLAGTLSGKGDGDNFEVLAKGPSFTANLTLVTRGDRQSVVIKSQETSSGVKGVRITLHRG
jgi:hypothetical protein